MNSIPTQPIAMLRHYLRPHRGRVALLFLLLGGSIALQLLGPQLLGRFVDTAAAGADGSANRLYVIAALFFAAVLAQKVLHLVTVYLTEDLGWATTNALRADLTAHVLRLDMGFHKLRTPGELIERIDGDVGQLAEYFSEIVVSLLGNGLLVAGILVLVFIEDWRVGLVGLGYALIMLTLFRVIQARMVRLYTRVSQASAELLGFLEEYMTGTEDVLPNGGAAYVMQRLYPLLNSHAALRTRTYTLSTAVGSTSWVLYAAAVAATMGLAALAYRAGTMTIGTVFLLVFYVGLLESPLDAVRRELASIQRALAGVNRTRELFLLRPEVTESATGAAVTLADSPPGVRFEDVTFAYKDRRPTTDDRPPEEGRRTTDDDSDGGQRSAVGGQDTVLRDVSFALAPGRVLGVLGRTGSGKTTLTRLLFRLYDVDAGTITLDGVDLRAAGLGELRRHVGLVTQDVQLFAATVRDNLTLFANYDPARPAVPDDDVTAALESLGLGLWLRGLPDGLDTLLESGGKGLSAGQAQLLALARVFLRDPRLVVLDEASSRLDPATEGLLERAIDRLLAGRTGIVIAHRLR
ncbi:MAG: ABC transporter ATP-binding protein, partial [Candidatus Promineofilum sp.]|nr:ABC transporter ATP-binding protein [Promineifilum sp.]